MKRWFVLLALLPLLAWAQLPRSVAGVEVPAPPPAGNAADTHWGVTVPDPYRKLEDVKDPEVQRWLRAQADATEAILARLPGREKLLARIREIDAAAAGVVGRVVRTDGGRLFFLRREPGQDQFRLYRRDGLDGADQLLVDPEAMSRAAGRPHAILDWSPSPDGKRLAYSIQVGGGEIGVLHVIDVESGKPLRDPIDGVRFASVSWLEDGSGLFHSRLREGFAALPATERFQNTVRWFRSLDGKRQDRPVFSAALNTELKLPPIASAFVAALPGTAMAGAWVRAGVDRNLQFFLTELEPLLRGEPQWRKVVDSADEVSAVVFTGDAFVLKSAKGAPRYRLLRLPLREPDVARAEVLLPETEGVLDEVSAAREGLYITRRDGVVLSLWRIARGATRAERVPLPVQGNVDIADADPRRAGALLRLGSWTRSAKLYALEPGSAEPRRLMLARDGAFDAPENIESREVMVTSHDGVRVPLSILQPKGLKLDGRAPTLLYGYGAYGTTDDPGFGPRWLAWLEQGGVIAIAHVRGGGAFGKAWHDAGRKTTKPNTWKDAIAAAEWLVANGYTARDRLGIYGGSAGGILVGRAITERPDLFAAAAPSVPVLDTVRSETRANGAANVPEYGTVQKEDEFRGLLAMSSYHALKPGLRYPAVMLFHGVNDTRVDVWQSAKFAARLAAIGGGDRPVLMRLDYESGHGSGTTLAQGQTRIADQYSFFLWQFGVAAFQPRAP